MKFKRIDAKDINYADSAAKEELKVGNTKGVGECRLYIGRDETALDEFFDFNNIESFFMLKQDLVKYLEDSKVEYESPTREYRSNISDLYDDNVKLIESLDENLIKLRFRKKVDSQKRYYIVLQNGKENRIRYSFLREICLPRFTIITFVKLIDNATNKMFIYLKPIFYIDPIRKEVKEQEKIESRLDTKIQKQKYREGQTKYRLNLLTEMPACLITGVADERILIACHVKPYKDCQTDEEKYDVKNGLTLTPTYHLLFDIGFITFSSEGRLCVSPFLSNLNKTRLNLQEGKTYCFQNGTEKYMRYHRENIFNTFDASKFDELDLID